MALSPKERERIIEEETLRFTTRRDLQAQACASHPRRGRWLWVLALALLALVLWHHGRCCRMGMACHGGIGMMGMEGCHHGWVVPPAAAGDDGAPLPPPADGTAKGKGDDAKQ